MKELTREETRLRFRNYHVLESVKIQSDGHGGREAIVTCRCGQAFNGSGQGIDRGRDGALVDLAITRFHDWHNAAWLVFWEQVRPRTAPPPGPYARFMAERRAARKAMASG